MKNESKNNSIRDSWAALISMLKTVYKLMPVLMVCFTFLMIFLAEKFANNSSLQLAMLTIVIFLSSIAIYLKSKNYGEAVLALAAGLFTVFTVDWTPSLFISFIIVWVAFTIVVFLTASLRLASKSQSIYIEAVSAIKPQGISRKECEKQLQTISNKLNNSILGPIERAEIIRVFAYRKITLPEMKLGLKWVNIYFALTRIPYLALADFIADIIKNSNIINQRITGDNVFDHIYSGMRRAPVMPEEYIEAFRRTRHILIKYKKLVPYFDALNSYFDSGTSPDDIQEYIEQVLNIS